MDEIDDIAETELQPGMYLDDYRLLAKIGRGGYATVYLAEAPHARRANKERVALKVLRSGHGIEKFRREAFITAHLRHHPHIVRFEGQHIDYTPPYIVLEYAPYGSLAQRYPSGKMLPPMLVLLYVKQIASALLYIHQQGFIHCDVKPENIMLRGHHETFLADFGIAQKAHTFSAQLEGAGTVSYMAPEQIQGGPDFASDQYALAITAYQLLTGTLPFRGSSEQVRSAHLYRRPLSIRLYNPDLPQRLDMVLQKALAKDPRYRFRTVWDFALAFEVACIQAQLTQRAVFNQPGEDFNTHSRPGAATSHNGHITYRSTYGERRRPVAPQTTRRAGAGAPARQRVPLRTTRGQQQQMQDRGKQVPQGTGRHSTTRRVRKPHFVKSALLAAGTGGGALLLLQVLGVNIQAHEILMLLYVVSSPVFVLILAHRNRIQLLICLLLLLAEAITIACNVPLIFCLLYEILIGCCAVAMIKGDHHNAR